MEKADDFNLQQTLQSFPILLNIFNFFKMISENIEKADNIDAALSDPFAKYLAIKDNFSALLLEERVLFYHGFLNGLREYNPENAYLISAENNTQDTKIIDKKLNEFYTSLFDNSQYGNFVTNAKQFIETFPMPEVYKTSFFNAVDLFLEKPWMKSIPAKDIETYHEIEKKLKSQNLSQCEKESLENKSAELIYKFNKAQEEWHETIGKPSLLSAQKYMVEEKSNEYGINFNSLYEAQIHGEKIRVTQIVEKILHAKNVNIANYAQELITRMNAWRGYHENIKDDILENKTRADSNVLRLLDEMIIDFIKVKPSSYWKNTADGNFKHNYKNELLVRANLEKVRSNTEIILNSFEYTLNQIKKIFLDKKDSFYINDYINEKNIKEELDFRYSLLYRYQGIIIDKILEKYEAKNNYDIFVEEEIKNHYGIDAKSFISCQRLLEKIELYDFAIVQQFYLDENGKPISGIDLNKVIYQAALPFLNDPEFNKKLTPVIRQIVNQKIKDEMEPLLELVKNFINSRQEDIDGFMPVLGLGFSGPLFNVEHNDNKENKIYLAFSKSGYTFEHYILLKLSIEKAIHEIREDNNNLPVRIEILHPHVFELRKREDTFNNAIFTNDFSIEHDLRVHKYILSRVIEFIFFTNPEIIHPDIIGIWLKLASQIVNRELNNISKDKKTDHKAKLIKFNQLKIALEEKELPLSKDNFDYLKVIIMSEEISCAESLLSRHGHTNHYIPISFRPNHEQIIKIGEKDIRFGANNRPMIEPCYKCQMLSAAYMIWSEITDQWHLDELQNRAHQQNKEAIPIRWHNSNGEIYHFDSNLRESLFSQFAFFSDKQKPDLDSQRNKYSDSESSNIDSNGSVDDCYQYTAEFIAELLRDFNKFIGGSNPHVFPPQFQIFNNNLDINFEFKKTLKDALTSNNNSIIPINLANVNLNICLEESIVKVSSEHSPYWIGILVATNQKISSKTIYIINPLGNYFEDPLNATTYTISDLQDIISSYLDQYPDALNQWKLTINLFGLIKESLNELHAQDMGLNTEIIITSDDLFNQYDLETKSDSALYSNKYNGNHLQRRNTI